MPYVRIIGNSRGRKTVTRVTGYRKNITPATQAALWTLASIFRAYEAVA